ncbi:MAG: fibronectin type III domain-containing protein [Bacteroidales bacterium]|nr:fibronectin type III domain-containing protein [Bacteroidales bacterium]
MKKIHLLIATLFLSMMAMAQNNPPQNVTVTTLSTSSVRVAWEAPSGVTQPTRLNLFNSADLVTMPSSGHMGADVSALYGGQSTLGYRAKANTANLNQSMWVTDDFRLNGSAVVSKIDFFVFQEGDTTLNPFSGCYLRIYRGHPSDPTAVPVWTSGAVNCLASVSGTGIYRTRATTAALLDTTRPVMCVSANVNASLAAGTYWLAVCFETAGGGMPYVVPRSIVSELSTGNAFQYDPASGIWNTMSDSVSLEQMGLPFVVRGEFVSDRLSGFHVYRDNTQVTTTLVEGFEYVDTGLDDNHQYCYHVEAVYGTGGPAASGDECATTFEDTDPCLLLDLPYLENFDGHTTGTGRFDVPCWHRLYSAGGTNYPYLHSTHYSGDAGVYMSASTTSSSYLIAPPLIADSMSYQLTVKFMMKKGQYTASSHIVVGAMTDPTNVSTFMPIDTFIPNPIEDWQPATVHLSQSTATGRYITLRAIGYHSYIDDFGLYYTDCLYPEHVEVSSLEANSVQLSWDSTGVFAYDLEYRLPGDVNWVQVFGLTDTFYTITGLDEATNYVLDVRIKPTCGGEHFFTTTVTFTTPCMPLTPPFVEDFEGYASGSQAGYPVPPCWRKANSVTVTPGVNYPFINSGSANAYSGVNYVYFMTSSTTSYGDNYLILPASSVPINTLELSLMAREINTSGMYVGKIQVGVMTDPLNLSTFTSVSNILPTTTNYETFTVSFANYSGPEGYITLKAPKTLSGFNCVYVDNIVVSVVGCSAPVSVEQQQGTDNSITCVWHPEAGTTALSYTLAYIDDTDPDAVWIEVPGITDTVYTVTGLNENNTYKFKVKTICPNGESAYSFAETFRTLCSQPLSVPCFLNFDNMAELSFMDCWLRPYAYVSSTTLTIPSVHDNIINAHSGTKSMRYTKSTWIVTPPIDANIEQLSISFWANKWASTSGTMEVGVMSNPFDTTTFEFVDSVAAISTSQYQFVEIPLTQVQTTGPNRHIAIRLRSSNTTAYYIDDLNIDYLNSCSRPVNVMVDNITQTSAYVSWPMNTNILSWNLRVKPVGDDSNWQIYNDLLTSGFLLNNLSPSTTYQVQLQANCSSGGTSYWSVDEYFITDCGPISTLPYIENFDTYGTYSGSVLTYPACWTHGSSDTLSPGMYPYLAPNYFYSNPASFNFYTPNSSSSDIYYIFAATPRVVDTIDMQMLTATFRAYTTDAANWMQIGFMTDSTRVSTFQPYATIQLSQPRVWEEFMIDFSQYAGVGRFIAFRMGGGNRAMTIFLDNFKLDYSPTCFKPQQLVVDSITQTSVVFSWIPGDAETEWELAFKEDTASSWSIIPYVADTVYELSGLDAATTYQIKVRSVCGVGDVSEFTDEMTVTTLCDAITMLPYEENFDAPYNLQNKLPYCWSKYYSGTESGYPYIITTQGNAYSAPGALYCYANSSFFDIAVLPELDPSILIENLKLTFKARTTTAGSKVEVGVMTNPLDPNTFVSVETIAPEVVSVWEDFTVYFAHYMGQGRFVAIRCGDGVGFNTVIIDNMSLDNAEYCFRPLDVVVGNISHETAEINWYSPSSISNCTYVYGESGFQPDTAFAYTTQNTGSLELTQLVPNTSYDIYIRNDCAGGMPSPWSHVCTFTTLCAPLQVPYVQNFDQGDYGPGIIPECWLITGNGSAFVDNNANSYQQRCVIFSTSDASAVYLTMPAFDATISTVQLNFFAKFGNMNYSLDVGVMSNPADTSTFELVERVNARTNVWNEFHIPLVAYSGTGRYITIRSSYRALTAYVDNLSVTFAPGCVKPANLHAIDLTANSVTLAWRKGSNESNWEVVYGPSGFNPNVLTSGVVSVPATDDTTDIIGLTPATYYDVYVRSACDDSTFSEWSQVFSFRTDCLPIDTFPYVQTFDNITTFPFCWERNDNVSISTAYPNISQSSLYFYSGIGTYSLATTPPVNRSVNTLFLQFDYKAATPDYFLYVGVMSDPNDITTFSVVDSVYSYLPAVFETKYVSFANYTGQGQYIAFLSQRGETYNYAYIDNVVISEAFLCVAPENVVATNVTSSSVTLSWQVDQNMPSPQDYIIRYAEEGTGVYTYVNGVAAMTHTVTGLQAGTSYVFEVQSYCTSGDSSAFSFPLSVSTLCASQTVPYIENFDGITTSATYQTPGVLPTCWQGYSTSGYTVMQPHVVSRNAGTSNAFAFSVPNCLLMQAYPTDTTMVMLPAFDQLLYNLKISFSKWMNSSNSLYSQLWIGYATDPYDWHTFVPIMYVNPESSVTLDSVSFQAATTAPANARMAFLWTNANVENMSVGRCCLDNIRVAPLVSCDQPTDLLVTAFTHQDATIVWNGHGANQWEVQYKPVASTTWNTTQVGNPTYSLNGLTANTSYHVRVRAKCNVNVYSVWSDTLVFTTLQENVCLDPTSLTVANVTYSSVGLSWDQNNAQSWNVRYKKAASSWTTIPVNSNQYTLTGLDAETTYEVQVQAVCGNNLTSDWTASVTFTTLQAPVCNAPTDLAVAADIYRATVVWTPGGDENTWNVQIRENNAAWSEVIVETHTDHVFNNLSPNTPYQVRVQAVCDELTSDFAMISFNTLPDGIADYELGITLYPNPNNGRFTINNEQLIINSVQVYDVYGKLLKTVEVDANTIELDVRELSSGMYFVRISTEKGMVTKNFVKK